MLEIVSANIDDGVIVVNDIGEIVFYNASANNQAGVSFENAVGKHILDVFQKLDKDSSTLLRVMATGKPMVGDIQRYYNHNHKAVTIVTTTHPIFNNGKITGAVEISKDIEQYDDINKKLTLNKKDEKKTAISEAPVFGLESIIGKSTAINLLKERVVKVSKTPSPVMVTGETGTGKEMVVQSIHNLSEQRTYPFIAQNCAAIPVTLLESLLFGTSAGGFTGSKDKAGLFELADNGTLFLDEINAMDINLQAKLLRVIQDGYIRRIGDKYIRKVNVRIIAAMNVRPDEALKSGLLRKDLFYRLNVLNIHIPPLRERQEDILVLIDHFIDQFNKKFNKNIRLVSPEARKKMQHYHWPGNVRELEHAIEFAVLMSEDDSLKTEDLPESIEKLIVGMQDSAKGRSHIQNDTSLKEIINKYEKSVLEEALANHQFSITETAKSLMIPRQTLHYKIKNLGIRIIKKTKESSLS